jgi:hypothetical protein
MSMFDYDARPVTPLLVLVGETASRGKRCAAAIGEGSMAVALIHRRLAEAGGD